MKICSSRNFLCNVLVVLFKYIILLILLLEYNVFSQFINSNLALCRINFNVIIK